jgi:hypothetical protein
LLHTVEDLAKDLLAFLVADVTLGAGLAFVVCCSADLSNAFDGNLVGPGGLVGVLVAGGVAWLFGPAAIIASLAAGVAAGAITDAAIRHRQLTDDEYRFASIVFANTLPPRERIYVTNLSSGGGRSYTWPNVDQSVLLNINLAFDDPTGYTDSHYSVAGQLLIHELTHAWQVRALSFVPGMICQRVTMTSSYIPDPSLAWTDLGLEQQGATVDGWFNRNALGWTNLDDLAAKLASPTATQDAAFKHIANQIRLGLD